MATKEIAFRLNRTVNSIINSAGPLGISAGRPIPWSDKEKDFLKSNYKHIPMEKISSALGRSALSITAMVSKLKLSQKV